MLKVLVVLFILALARPIPVAAQAADSSSTARTTKSWVVPRTPWGDPDIQGLWPANDMQGTPYERAEELIIWPRSAA